MTSWVARVVKGSHAVVANRYSFDSRLPGHPSVWVTLDVASVVGFVIVGPSRDDDLLGLGEVLALYVLPERWREGVGAALLEKGEHELLGDGFAEALIWVLDRNSPSRTFYEARGWMPDGRGRTVRMGEKVLTEVRYRRTLSTPVA
jgi:GNAT superfamily N-acetyltransferase